MDGYLGCLAGWLAAAAAPTDALTDPFVASVLLALCLYPWPHLGSGNPIGLDPVLIQAHAHGCAPLGSCLCRLPSLLIPVFGILSGLQDMSFPCFDPLHSSELPTPCEKSRTLTPQQACAAAPLRLSDLQEDSASHPPCLGRGHPYPDLDKAPLLHEAAWPLSN